MVAPSAVERSLCSAVVIVTVNTAATRGEVVSGTGRLRNQVCIVGQLTVRSYVLSIGVCMHACVYVCVHACVCVWL